MLSQLFETLIVSLINLFSRNPRRAGAKRRGGLLSRLMRRGAAPAAAKPDALPADPPVVIGDVVPSAREALRQPRTDRREAALSSDERKKHVYVTGGTGAGKTNLLLNMIDADVAAGRGIGFLRRPGGHGRPRPRPARGPVRAGGAGCDRLLLVDLRSPPAGSGLDYVVGLDPLSQGSDPYSQVAFVMDVLRQQFGGSLGCQTEELLRNVLLAMALSPDRPPLADVELFLASPEARGALLQGVEDRGVLRFFARFNALADTRQWISPVMNKLTPMLSLPALRRFLGDPCSVSLRDFLDSRPDPILVVALAADEIHGAAALAGTLLVSAVASAIMRSGRKAAAPFFLFLDEFQNLAAGSSEKFEELISESRRYGMSLTLSHQSTSQLEPRLRVLIRNVISTHVVLATGGVDSDLLAGEMSGDEPKAVMKQILLSQKPGEAVLTRRGLPTERIKTRYAPDPPVAEAAVRALRLACLRRHGRPVAEVEADMREREARFLPPVAAPLLTVPAPQSGEKQAVGKQSGGPGKTPRKPPSTDQYEVRDHDE